MPYNDLDHPLDMFIWFAYHTSPLLRNCDLFDFGHHRITINDYPLEPH